MPIKILGQITLYMCSVRLYLTVGIGHAYWGLRGLVVKSADSYTLDLSTLWFEPRLGHM